MKLPIAIWLFAILISVIVIVTHKYLNPYSFKDWPSFLLISLFCWGLLLAIAGIIFH